MLYNEKVTVIIPVYKAKKYLVKCIESIFNQCYDNIEIYLVDDGCPENSGELCEILSKKYNNIYVIHKKNGGAASARNAALLSIKNTDFIIFLDSDDMLDRDSINGMLELQRKNDADLVISDRFKKLYNDKKTIKCKHFTKKMYKTKPNDFVLDVIMEQGRAWRSTAVLFKFEIIKNNHILFPEGQTAEDVVFNLDFFKYTKIFSIYDKSTLICNKHDGSVTATFQDDFENTIWKIDDAAKSYLTFIKSDEGLELKRHELLFRNIVLYIISIISRRCKLNKTEKKEKINLLLNDSRYKMIYSFKHKVPYFDNCFKRIFIRILYRMFEKNYNNLAIEFLFFLGYFNLF